MSLQENIGAFSIGTSIAGGFSGLLGQIYGGQAQQQYYDYQAGVARLNAQIMQQNSEFAIQAGEAQALQEGQAGAQQLGRIVANQSASGLAVTSGSFKAVQQSAAELNRMQTTFTRSNAAKVAYNYRAQANVFGAEAAADVVAGKNAREAGIIGGIGSILGTASSVSSEWLKGGTMGLWGGSGGSSGAAGGMF
jgi:hypothetical protein